MYVDDYPYKKSNIPASKHVPFYTKIHFKSILASTETDYHFFLDDPSLDVDKPKVWIPKASCKNLDLVEKTVWVHKSIYYQILTVTFIE